jgi:alpha-2-macroglobulin
MKSSWLPVVVFLGLMILSASRLGAAEAANGIMPADMPLADAQVRQLMQDGKYPEARKAIAESAKAKDAPQDYLTYLSAWSFYQEKQYDQAIAAYEQFEKQFPQSPWFRQSRFARAMALERKGDAKNAELIYRAEAEYLLSAGRRQQLADIYLEFANGYFHPPKEDQKPDFNKAMEFYRKALETGPKADARAEVELLVAQCLQKLNRNAEAAKAYAKFIADHPGGPLDIEARYRLGECRLADNNLREARRAWQDLLAKYPDDKSPRIAEAAFNMAKTWRIPAPRTNEELNLGVAASESFLERFPAHKLASQANLEIAKSYICRSRYEDAAACLNRFIKDERYKDSPEVPEAWNLLGQSCQLQKKFTEALAVWREYLVKYPTQEAWSSVQKGIIDTEYLMALEKYKAKDYPAAVKLLSEFLAKYPLEPRDPGILYLFGQISHEQKQWDAAIAEWRRLTSKYPRSQEASEAQYMIAQTLEQELGKLEEALEEYRKVSFGRRANDSLQAAVRLAEKSMTVAVERIFRSDETPKLKVTTRNIESVTVRAYKVDLETYFRKTHQIGNVEQLAVALIDPDATFEFKVPGYAKYQQIESAIEVPLPEKVASGVMAVTVSSASLEATSLVIQSDLDIIVKSSRDKVFVFAENMLTGKPWNGVRLLASNGKQVFVEGTTGESGVFQKDSQELNNIGDVRVFAVAGGHVASSNVELQGVAVARGLSDKGYIYTDRPVYQPGQTACVRGCVRQVADDAYTFDKNGKYTVEVFDARNRMLGQQEVKLSAFGAFETQFVLPAASPQGQYRILARDEAGHVYQGAFQVQQYREEAIHLAIDAPRKVWYRGELIEGIIRATYYYGAPLAGREIRYRLASEAVITARTDDKGEVHFSLPTRDFNETQVLPLAVLLSEQNLQTSENFVLAAQGFSIGVSTVRPVFVSGEPFEVKVKILDAESKPTAEKLALKLLELLPVQGKVGERLLEEHPVATAADGMARQSLKLEKGGRYIVRVEGMDRFKNPISGQVELRISDEADQQRLLILSDRHTFKAGDTAEVRIHWREAPALALLTFQGAHIFDYMLVNLKTGTNTLSLPVSPKLAPNFELCSAVMTNEKKVARFHEASSLFAVERDLQIKIAAKRKGDAAGAIRPGDEMEVTIATSDPQGKPIAAEVSLAMVQQALLDRVAWPVAPIQEYFQGSDREAAVRTSSSITYSYVSPARSINSRLLAEQQRRELAAEEAASRAAGLMEDTLKLRMRENIVNKNLAARNTADFNSLIDLITQTVQPSSWEDTSGSGSMREFPTNLEIVVNQTQSASTKRSRTPAESKGSEDASADKPSAAAKSQGETVALASLPVRETGYWNPAIVTGADGKAVVTVKVPEDSSAWTLLAKGITADTLVGEAVEKLVVKKDLFGELKLPLAFTDGDEAKVAVTVHNNVLEKGPIEVLLKTTVGNRTVSEKNTIEAASKGLHDLMFNASLLLPRKPGDAKQPPASLPAEIVFELSVSGGQYRDVVRRAVPLLPYGVPVYNTAGGSAVSDIIDWVESPKDMTLEGPSLQIVIGPTVEQSLMDIVAAPALACQIEAGRIASDVESATSDLMASLALQKLTGASRDAGGPNAQTIDGRVRASLGLLILTQGDDGGWGWTSGCQSNPQTSARALWAIELARQSGYSVSDQALDKALAYLRSEASKTDNGDSGVKAVLLHALSVAGAGDFVVANRLHRERSSLEPAAQAYLALALAQMDRKTMAREVLDVLAKQDIVGTVNRPTGKKAAPMDLTTTEFRALWALALQQVSPKSAQAKQLIDWLLANRNGYRWKPDRATGPAALALCDWFAENRFQGEHYKLAVSVNGKQVEVLDIDQAAGTRVINVPPALLVPEKQRIDFHITGRGRFAYQCVLGGFVPAEKLKSTTTDWEIERTYQPAPQEYDGQAVPRGFNIVDGKAAQFRNPMTQLPVGRRGLVELNVRDKRSTQPDPSGDSSGRHDYLVITDPIPGGTTVIAQSIRGGFDRVEIVPGAIVFFVRGRQYAGNISYELDGYLPGAYRAGPTVMRNAYRPEQMAVAKPASLTVLPFGAPTSDKYRLTPVELYELGKRLKDKGDLKAAAEHLAELVDKWNLQEEVYKQVVEMLFDIHAQLGPPAKVVQYFEILKEKWPRQEIPFDKVVKLGAAYHDLGEFDRSYLVFRAAVEGSFTRESGVAGFLEQQGEFLRSVDVMARLLREYPPEPYAADADFALAQRIYAKAPEAASDPKLRQQKINRVVLIHHAWRMLERFLTAYPADPAADQAAFAAANALLELEDYKEAAAAATRCALRYPNSDLLNSYWYLNAYCDFATGAHQAALDMCRKVAEAQHLDKKTGRTVESQNKWRAIYIMGQVYHSLGQAADAIREYRRVEDRFPDAKLSIAYFLRKSIELPETTTVKPGSLAEVELKFRNIAECDVKVYRIDLMKYSLLAGNLGGIARINLSGIKPLHDAVVQLGDGKDYRDRVHKLTLPTTKEGAYLVVCRGEDLHASGLMLVTPLTVEVQADPVSGQVRTMVKDATTDRYLNGVQVKVIGNRMSEFVSGTTDLRGVFVANGIAGAATVIAQADAGRCAFFRSGPVMPQDGSLVYGPTGQPMINRPSMPQPGDLTMERPRPSPKTAQPTDESKPAQNAQIPSETDLTESAESTKPDSSLLEPIDITHPGEGANEMAIQEALKSPTDIEFFETPLDEAVNYLKEHHKIEIQIDKKALESVGMETTTPVTKSLKGIQLRSALKLLLRDYDSTYMINNGVLMITTPEVAQGHLVIKVYPVQDLVTIPGESGLENADFDSLIDLIGCVQPESWDASGGPGSIKAFPNKYALVISETQEVHEEVAALLEGLRKVGGGKKAVDDQSSKVRQSASEGTAASGKSATTRSNRQRAAMGVGGMGMGGMGMGGYGMGGMGMGGFMGGMPPGAENPPDLLEGLRDSNRGNQDRQMQRLKKRYDEGMGMGGMGGMAGGFM